MFVIITTAEETLILVNRHYLQFIIETRLGVDKVKPKGWFKGLVSWVIFGGWGGWPLKFSCKPPGFC